MKIKVSKIVPKGYVAISLWPFGIYFSEDKYIQSIRILNHEKIHWRQQWEMLGIIFYLWYGIEYLIRRINNNHIRAYKRISFEVEANANMYYSGYLKHRKFFAFLKYL